MQETQREHKEKVEGLRVLEGKKASKYTKIEQKNQDSIVEREGWCMAVTDCSKRKGIIVTMEE